MNGFQIKKEQWFLELKPGDKIMLYQPKVIPADKLSLIKKIIKYSEIRNGYYTKISVNSNGEIFDYHLVGLDFEPGFNLSSFIKNLDLNAKALFEFKFIDLSNNDETSKQVRRSKLIYEK